MTCPSEKVMKNPVEENIFRCISKDVGEVRITKGCRPWRQNAHNREVVQRNAGGEQHDGTTTPKQICLPGLMEALPFE
jgi:hypothetical protein